MPSRGQPPPAIWPLVAGGAEPPTIGSRQLDAPPDAQALDIVVSEPAASEHPAEPWLMVEDVAMTPETRAPRR